MAIRGPWESIVADGNYTVFQSFELNLLAVRVFAGREEPFVICVESPNGTAIVPTAVRHSDKSLRLLGEELFDYRCVLHQGDPEILRSALAVLAQRELPLEIVAVRERAGRALSGDLPLLPFCKAPAVRCLDISAHAFAGAHPHLARNMRRLDRLGFKLRRDSGENSGLLRSIYERKAAQDPNSLFHDSVRADFMVNAAMLLPELFEIVTLEDGNSMAAALVVLH
ncbi:MAG: hypothetical protein WA738_14505, partial [Candidatus Angelobacter sp.]